MPAVHIQLLGNLRVSAGQCEVDEIEGGKARELLGYLLVHRHRTHPRETLAGLLWGDTSTSQSRKYLRQALWQLQATLHQHDVTATEPLIVHESDTIRLNLNSHVWIDIDVLERAFDETKGIGGEELTSEQVRMLQDAVDLYRGDLLEGWYQDWCLHERERLQTIYMVLLDKLMRHCEQNDAYELGLMYGEAIIGIDRAREATYRSLMRLHARAGERTSALRQYARCAAALSHELGVHPSRQTSELFVQIRDDRFDVDVVTPVRQPATPATIPGIADVIDQLSQISSLLGEYAHQIRRDALAVDQSRRE